MRDAEKNNQYGREIRAWYKAHGICYNCRCAPAEYGRSLCKPCYNKVRQGQIRRDPDGSKRKEYLKERRAKLKALGLCPRCGRKTDGIHVNCNICRAKGKEEQQVRRIRQRLKEAANADHRTQ